MIREPLFNSNTPKRRAERTRMTLRTKMVIRTDQKTKIGDEKHMDKTDLFRKFAECRMYHRLVIFHSTVDYCDSVDC